jgi:beta-galactosidase
MIKKFFSAIVILFLLPVLLIARQKAEMPFDPDFFPFSVWYSGGDARAPMLSEVISESREEWRRDLQQIKDLGFNTVRTWVEWQRAEPHPGEYDFENLQLLMELAEEVGLQVFIQMYVDSAPDWVGQRHPTAKFQTQSGVQVESQSAPGFCTDHSGVAEAVHSFYTETARVANEYSNFYGWDLWSEPHIINWANIDYVQNAQFCYCPYTQKRFRSWLRDKYETIENLNTAWHRGFQEWKNVSPPRFSTILSYTDYLDWKTFIYEKLAEDLGARYDAVRVADRNNVVTSHAAVSSIIISPHMGVGATDDFLMAKEVDFYGVSLYPKHNHPERHWPAWRVMNMMDFARSANKEKGGWYVGELQAGIGTIALLVGDPVTPGDHRVWIWSAIAKGAKAINIYAYYPMSSGYESGGYGLVNQDGSLTERAVHAGQIASIVDANQELFLRSQPEESRVAIVYNPLSQMVGGAQRRQDFPGGHHDSLIGYYRVFAEHNIPVDFIHRKDLEEGELSQYQLILLPWAMMFTEAAARGVKAFVDNGGYVAAEARFAWNDDRGYASDRIPGMGLSNVFGVQENEVWMREEEILFELTGHSHPATASLQSGSHLIGTLYGNSMTPLKGHDVQVLANLSMTGDPAITVHRYGEGEAMMIGTFLGMANHPDLVNENVQFILGLADWAGIERTAQSSHDGRSEAPVAVRLQKNEDGWLLFAINHGMDKEQVEITLRTNEGQSYSLHELTRDTRSQAEASEGNLSVRVDMDGRDARVWSIKKQYQP